SAPARRVLLDWLQSERGHHGAVPARPESRGADRVERVRGSISERPNGGKLDWGSLCHLRHDRIPGMTATAPPGGRCKLRLTSGEDTPNDRRSRPRVLQSSAYAKRIRRTSGAPPRRWVASS